MASTGTNASMKHPEPARVAPTPIASLMDLPVDAYGGRFIQFGDMQVGLVPTAALRQRRPNYRQMKDADFEALKASVARFGFKSFILVTVGVEAGTYEVVDGHHRWKTAVEKGIPQVPVVLLTADEAGDGGLDFAMLSFNVTADILPDVYLDVLKELGDKYGGEEVGKFTGLTEAFIADLVTTLDATTLTDITDESKLTSDSSRGRSQAVLLPNTKEVQDLVAEAQTLMHVNTAAEAVLIALKEAVERRHNATSD